MTLFIGLDNKGITGRIMPGGKKKGKNRAPGMASAVNLPPKPEGCKKSTPHNTKTRSRKTSSQARSEAQQSQAKHDLPIFTKEPKS